MRSLVLIFFLMLALPSCGDNLCGPAGTVQEAKTIAQKIGELNPWIFLESSKIKQETHDNPHAQAGEYIVLTLKYK